MYSGAKFAESHRMSGGMSMCVRTLGEHDAEVDIREIRRANGEGAAIRTAPESGANRKSSTEGQRRAPRDSTSQTTARPAPTCRPRARLSSRSNTRLHQRTPLLLSILRRILSCLPRFLYTSTVYSAALALAFALAGGASTSISSSTAKLLVATPARAEGRMHERVGGCH